MNQDRHRWLEYLKGKMNSYEQQMLLLFKRVALQIKHGKTPKLAAIAVATEVVEAQPALLNSNASAHMLLPKKTRDAAEELRKHLGAFTQYRAYERLVHPDYHIAFFVTPEHEGSLEYLGDFIEEHGARFFSTSCRNGLILWEIVLSPKKELFPCFFHEPAAEESEYLFAKTLVLLAASGLFLPWGVPVFLLLSLIFLCEHSLNTQAVERELADKGKKAENVGEAPKKKRGQEAKKKQ